MKGGVVFRVADAMFFLPATVAGKVLPMPGMARVPGAPDDLLGVALVEGEMVPVVTIGEVERRVHRRAGSERHRADNRPMLLCTFQGERIGMVGLQIVATGNFEATGPDHVMHDGASVPSFDVGAVLSRLRAGRWAV